VSAADAGPKPVPRDDTVRARMSAQACRDTTPELALRSALHRLGLRFRVHRRPLPAMRREADLVFPGSRVAVFVDGCFWHCCPEHATEPRTNRDWWRHKLAGNQARDQDTNRRLREAGWIPVRVWEHEPVEYAATRVRNLVLSRRRTAAPAYPGGLLLPPGESEETVAVAR
jgi:DNA mismatch endonuclease (patch repair protein)